MATGGWNFDIGLTQLSFQYYDIGILYTQATKTQTATAKISTVSTYIQTATAKIVISTGGWNFDIGMTTPRAVQTATARISSLTTKIQTATASIDSWAVLASLPASASTYSDSFNLVSGGNYQYRVAPVTAGIPGTWIYGPLYTIPLFAYQTATAKIVASRSNNSLMLGVNL